MRTPKLSRTEIQEVEQAVNHFIKDVNELVGDYNEIRNNYDQVILDYKSKIINEEAKNFHLVTVDDEHYFKKTGQIERQNIENTVKFSVEDLEERKEEIQGYLQLVTRYSNIDQRIEELQSDCSELKGIQLSSPWYFDLLWFFLTENSKVNYQKKFYWIKDLLKKHMPFVQRVRQQIDNLPSLYEEVLTIEQLELAGLETTPFSKSDYDNYRDKQRAVLKRLQAISQTQGRVKVIDDKIHEIIAQLKTKFFNEQIKELSLKDFMREYDHEDNLRYLYLSDVYSVKDLINHVEKSGIFSDRLTENLIQGLDDLKDQVDQLFRVQFDHERRSAEKTDLLNQLFILIEAGQSLKTLKSINLGELTAQYEKCYIPTRWNLQELSVDSFLTHEAHLNQLLNQIEDYQKVLNTINDYLNEQEQRSSSEIWEHFVENAAYYYALLESKYRIGKIDSDYLNLRLGLSQELIDSIHATDLNTDQINGSLRSWQDFGARYTLHQNKVLIGDEMGLGKTLISIATMSHLHHEQDQQHFLVLCPKSIMINWRREIKKFSSLKVYTLHGDTRARKRRFDVWQARGGVAITTYETAWRTEYLKDAVIDMLTVDEAHNIKNRGTKRSDYAYGLAKVSDYALYLTGTPLENNVQEMTNLISSLQPEIGHELWEQGNVSLSPITYRKTIAPVYLRRSRGDVKLELPKLEQIEEVVEFGPKEVQNYVRALAMGGTGGFHDMRRAAWSGKVQKDSPKLERLIELCQEAKSNGQKVIVFSYYLNVIETIEMNMSDYISGVITGSRVPSSQRRQEMIDEFREETDRNVLVAQIQTLSQGLNIQFANVIIFCEPQIKPSLETQAVARAYRMGQTEPVFVYRLITENSVDEHMMFMLQSKQALFDDFADKSYLQEQVNEREVERDVDTKLSEKQLSTKIISLERERLNVS